MALALGALLWAPDAAAQLCTQLAASNMVFTGYSPLGPGVSATSTITYSCVGAGTAWIAISANRTLRAGRNAMQFGLYQDGALHATEWPVTRVQVPVSGSGSVTVYGFLPAQDVAAGRYSARLTVTLYSGSLPTASVRLRVSTSGFVPDCRITAGTLAFGSYDPLVANAARPLDGSGTFDVRCTRGTAYRVDLGAGQHAVGGTRRMLNVVTGTEYLPYALYSDGARAQPWTSARTVARTATTWDPVTFTVYGRIPAQQPATAGVYLDTVQSTVNF